MLWLTACGTTSFHAPPVTPEFIRAGARQHADGRTLDLGRSVLLSRCIQCHALPDATQYDSPRLTAVVAKMAGRANLTEAQHDALLRYLLTARTTARAR